MSGTNVGPVTPTSGNTAVPQGYLGQGNLLQSNTTLLQPTPTSFRLSDALWLLTMGAGQTGPNLPPIAAEVTYLQNQIITLDGQVEVMQAQITTLQNDISTINARLAAAGIP